MWCAVCSQKEGMLTGEHAIQPVIRSLRTGTKEVWVVFRYIYFAKGIHALEELLSTRQPWHLSREHPHVVEVMLNIVFAVVLTGLAAIDAWARKHKLCILVQRSGESESYKYTVKLTGFKTRTSGLRVALQRILEVFKEHPALGAVGCSAPQLCPSKAALAE